MGIELVASPAPDQQRERAKTIDVVDVTRSASAAGEFDECASTHTLQGPNHFAAAAAPGSQWLGCLERMDFFIGRIERPGDCGLHE
jgi:hypothetical protein